MTRWRFYQGLRTEWRWYRFDEAGKLVAESDQGFAELRACMANAETAGFTGEAYQVLARESGNGTSTRGNNGKPSGREITQHWQDGSSSGTRM